MDRIEEHDTNSMKLTFPSRKAAEIAAEQGATLQGENVRVVVLDLVPVSFRISKLPN